MFFQKTFEGKKDEVATWAALKCRGASRSSELLRRNRSPAMLQRHIRQFEIFGGNKEGQAPSKAENLRNGAFKLCSVDDCTVKIFWRNEGEG